MPLLKCNSCHHEWEHIGETEGVTCSWCGAGSHVLAKKTAIEMLAETMDAPEGFAKHLRELLDVETRAHVRKTEIVREDD